MKVHLVTNTPYDVNPHVVPRMMKWMADKYGWSIAERKSDPKADVNYYGEYLAWKFANQVDTLKTGWHTHYEVGTPWKTKIWKEAAKDFDIRLYTSDLYKANLAKYGPVAKITPGIDREIFQPFSKRPDKNIVGTAAVGQKRKGEDLIEKLLSVSNLHNFKLAIVGSYWKWQTNWIPWYDMPIFYSQIDVYLVTSTIEGVPAPPLEALACGVKIVVPNKVGIMDELPEMPGLRHYEKGNFDDMVRAIKTVLSDKVSQEELRAQTEKYSPEAWCTSNYVAIEKIYKQKK